MGITLTSNFDVNAALPLDSRMVVADLTARDAIAAGRRFQGMCVYVLADTLTYQLKTGILNTDWVEYGGTSAATFVEAFSGDGGTLTFTLANDPLAIENTMVFVDGVYQQKTLSYTLSTTDVTFDVAPPIGVDNIEVMYTTPTGALVIPDDYITTVHILNGAVTAEKLAVGALARASVFSTSANYTATSAEDIILVDAGAGVRTITLPTAVGINGRKYTIKKIDSSINKVVIDGDGTETIDGLLTFGLYNANDLFDIISDGANWRIVNINITKESFVASTTGGLYSQTGGVWLTAPITQTSDSTRYPITSNTITIRKTARYKITCRNTVNVTNSEYSCVAYSLNGGSELPANYHLWYHDANAAGSTSHTTESSEATLTEGDVIRLRTLVGTNTRNGTNGFLEVIEL